ncbi:hypothetical protein BCR44DRAFT_1539609 [Catenaria anguillulae PL171]|uniref:Uncharacterized protein n=1 Tax=Catenaria anguillulae PL171 TaxID=765915 RepID=A0A1Y2HA72_9FUNG|nr:hypothetical protein BCR44DRAFT_1539609 [Catenaria anguillulae PL171]
MSRGMDFLSEREFGKCEDIEAVRLTFGSIEMSEKVDEKECPRRLGHVNAAPKRVDVWRSPRDGIRCDDAEALQRQVGRGSLQETGKMWFAGDSAAHASRVVQRKNFEWSVCVLTTTHHQPRPIDCFARGNCFFVSAQKRIMLTAWKPIPMAAAQIIDMFFLIIVRKASASDCSAPASNVWA